MTAQKDDAAAAFAYLAMLAIPVYAIVQIVAAWVGIAGGVGVWWAVIAIIVALLFKFTLPITVGAFFGAMNVWGWPWYFALLFAAPGLMFMALMIPGALGAALHRGRR